MKQKVSILQSKTAGLLLILSIATVSFVLNIMEIPRGWALVIYAAFALLIIAFMIYNKIPPFVSTRKKS